MTLTSRQRPEVGSLRLDADLALFADQIAFDADPSRVTHVCGDDMCRLDGARRATGSDLPLTALRWLAPDDPAIDDPGLAIEGVEEPTEDPAIVDLVGTAYRLWEGTERPVSILQLVFAMVLLDSRCLSEPTLPITELVAAAGLELRGQQMAHDPSLWSQRWSGDHSEILRELELDEATDVALTQVIETVATADSSEADLHEALDALTDPITLDTFAWVTLSYDDPVDLAIVEEFADRGAQASRSGRHRAVARWLLAVIAERRTDPVVAREQLELAVEAEPGWEPALERLGWTVADAGDLDRARALWRGVTHPRTQPYAHLLDRLARNDGPEPRRNDPCWCGSGRKFKQCHLGVARELSLPERIAWMCRKQSAFVEHQFSPADSVMSELLELRAGGRSDRESMIRANEDPMVMDAALHAVGWAQRFLSDRGSLLPDDERLLYEAWLLVDRSVHRVESVDVGTSLTLFDLRSAERVTVFDVAGSRSAQPGDHLCALVVPDGADGFAIIGGVIMVPPGRERDMLDLLDQGDELDLLVWLAAGEGPPVVAAGPGIRSLVGDGEFDADLIDDSGNLRVDEMRRRAAGTEPSPPMELDPATVAEIQTNAEDRWLSEPVPALGNVTPREAAEDPTRRDTLIRLIDSFDEAGTPRGGITFRPGRLREELGL